MVSASVKRGVSASATMREAIAARGTVGGNLLTALDALLEEGSVTDAAARLHVSAPR